MGGEKQLLNMQLSKRGLPSIRCPVLGRAGGGRRVEEEGGGAVKRRASMRSWSSHRPLQLDLCAEQEKEDGGEEWAGGVTSASSSAGGGG